MAADPLRQARPPDRGRDRALYDGFVEMIARRGAEPRISTDPNRWKHKLPSPVGSDLRILSLERARQDHAADTLAQGKVVAQLMGHAKVDTTLNVYTQVVDGALRMAAAKIGSGLFTIVHNPEGAPAVTR